MKFMVFPFNIHGFFPNQKNLVLCRQVSDRFSIVSLATGSTYVMFVKPTPSVVFEGTQIHLTKSTNDGGWEFSCVSWFFMVCLSLEHHLRNVMEKKHGIRHGNGNILVDWIWYAPWRSCYNACLKCVCIITSHTSIKKKPPWTPLSTTFWTLRPTKRSFPCSLVPKSCHTVTKQCWNHPRKAKPGAVMCWFNLDKL